MRLITIVLSFSVALCAIDAAYAAKSPEKVIALLEAVKRCNVPIVKALLAEKPNINAPVVQFDKDLFGRKAVAYGENLLLQGTQPILSGALAPECMETVAQLLAAGADPNVPTMDNNNWTYGLTPIFIAFAKYDEQLTDTLLKAGADPRKARTSVKQYPPPYNFSENQTPLMYMVAQSMLGAGVSDSSLHGVLSLEPKEERLKKYHPKDVEAATQHAAKTIQFFERAVSLSNIDARDKAGRTALMYARTRTVFSTPVVKKLIELGASPLVKDAEGRTLRDQALLLNDSTLLAYLDSLKK